MGGRIVGMEHRTDENLRDKQRGYYPAQAHLFKAFFQSREKEEERIDVQEVPVGQGASSSSIVIGHENDIDQDFCEESREEEPLVGAFFSEKEKDQEEKGREEIPGYSCESSPKIIEEIINKNSWWKKMFPPVPFRCHFMTQRVKGHRFFF